MDASNSTGADVSGTEIKDNTLNNSTGVDVSGSEGANVEDTTVSGNDATGTTLVDATGSNGADISGTDVSNNNLTDSTGVDVSGSEGTSVGDTNFSGNDASGSTFVDVSDASGTEITGTNVSDNKLSNSTAVNVDGSSGTKIEDSTFDKNTVSDNSAIIDVKNSTNTGVTDTKFSNNNITGNSSVIEVIDSPDTNMTGNNMTDNNISEDSSDIEVIDSNININAPDLVKYYGSSDRFIVNVTRSDKSPVVNETVIIGINGKNYTRYTNEEGIASIAINLGSGEYDVLVSAGNSTVNAKVTVKTTVFGDDIVKVFRNGTQYWATFIDTKGNYLADGTAVQFNINGVLYTRYIKGTEGKAKLNINLGAGQYIITAINSVTGENHANNITVISKLVENRDLVKYYRNGSQYTVKVLDDNGNAVGAGVGVTFNINGVFYTRQTNASGIAKLNINLHPGDYVITAEYQGCKVSNNIKVLPVLTAKDLIKKYGTTNQFVAVLVDGHGKPYGGQSVSFNINGVIYQRTTDSAGHAKLNINLMAGQYIITSSYNGQNVANTVTVNA